MSRLVDYFVVVGYDLDKRGELLKAVFLSGLAAADSKQKAGVREAGTGRDGTEQNKSALLRDCSSVGRSHEHPWMSRARTMRRILSVFEIKFTQ